MSAETHEPQSVLGPEKIEWRGLDSKVFEKLGQPGEYQLVGYHQPVHYLDTDGKLKDIDLTIEDGKVDKCCYIAEIMKEHIGIKIEYRDTHQKFEIVIKDIDGIRIPGREPDVITNGNVAEWREVAKDLDIIFEFQHDQVRIFRKLKSKDAPVKIHFETITQELDTKEQVHVNEKFFGQDAKGREVILDTKFEDPVTESLENGFKVVKQQIHDKFTNFTINIDPKTRLRTPTNEIEYPVMIDPVITLKAKERNDSGALEIRLTSGTSLVTAGIQYKPNDGNVPPTRKAMDTQTGIGTSRILLPGDVYGCFISGATLRDVARIVFQLTNSSAVGTVTAKIYDASTKTLLSTGDAKDASTLSGGTFFNFPNPSILLAQTGGGYYLAIEFQAGGSGTVSVIPSTLTSGGSPDKGVQVERVSGVWTELPGLQAPRIEVKERRGKLPNQARWRTLTSNGRSALGGTDGVRHSGYHTFRGITIPIGSTINSANLTLRTGMDNPSANGYPPWNVNVRAVDSKNFTLANPSTTKTNKTTIVSELELRTGGGAIPFIAPNKTTNTSSDGATAEGYPSTTVIDVQAIVQALVNKFDYSDDEIFIQIQGTLDQNFLGSTTYVSPSFKVYTHSDYLSRQGSKLFGVSGGFNQPTLTSATSQGTSIYTPKLVIDFTEIGPTDLDFVADAMILLQGSVFGRCKNGGP